MFFSKIRRPQWDIPVLLNLGFGKIYVEGDLSEVISDEISKVRYAPYHPLIRRVRVYARHLLGHSIRSPEYL